MGAPPWRRHIGVCAATGKRMYSTRKRAKSVAKIVGDGLAVYRCEACSYWHFGHRGTRSREEHRNLHREEQQ